MSRKLKGLTGEELPVTIFAIILLFIFLVSGLMSYSNYYSRAALVEQERVASSLAQKVLADNNGVISDPDSVLAQYQLESTRFEIKNLESGNTWAKGSTEGMRDVAASSLAVLIESGGNLYPGKVSVYVGK